MLADIHFVVQAVAKKDLDPALCHLEIRGGRATGYGGRIGMSTLIDCKLDVRPKAKPLWKALQATKESDEVDLYMTGAGRLGVKQGKFKAFIDCIGQDEPMTHLLPEGPEFDVPEELYSALMALEPYMAIDASRPWAQGLKITADSIFATNNIVLIQRWHGSGIPVECIIPSDAVTALRKIGQVPRSIQYNEGISMTFHFENDRWLSTHLIAQDGGWGRAEAIFDANTNTEGMIEVPNDFYLAIDSLKDMLGPSRYIFLKGDRICTSPNDEEGASIDIEVPDGPVFHAEQLRSLQEIATRINFTTYPKPCYFVGDKLRGVIVGVQV